MQLKDQVDNLLVHHKAFAAMMRKLAALYELNVHISDAQGMSLLSQFVGQNYSIEEHVGFGHHSVSLCCRGVPLLVHSHVFRARDQLFIRDGKVASKLALQLLEMKALQLVEEGDVSTGIVNQVSFLEQDMTPCNALRERFKVAACLLRDVASFEDMAKKAFSGTYYSATGGVAKQMVAISCIDPEAGKTLAVTYQDGSVEKAVPSKACCGLTCTQLSSRSQMHHWKSFRLTWPRAMRGRERKPLSTPAKTRSGARIGRSR